MGLREPADRPTVPPTAGPRRWLTRSHAVHRGQYLSRLSLHPAFLLWSDAGRIRRRRRIGSFHYCRRSHWRRRVPGWPGRPHRPPDQYHQRFPAARWIRSPTSSASALRPPSWAFAWGVQFVDTSIAEGIRSHLFQGRLFQSRSFLLWGAARLARFTFRRTPFQEPRQSPPQVFFRRLPIPARGRHGVRRGFRLRRPAARLVGPFPWPGWRCWCCWAFLMVCTWRYYSFKRHQPQQSPTPPCCSPDGR